MAPTPPSPPQPRTDPALTGSELFPLRSRTVKFWRSRALTPILVATLTTMVLLTIFANVVGTGTIDELDGKGYLAIVAGFLVVAMFIGLYAYSGEWKGMGWYLIPAVITLWQLTHWLRPYIHVFREILPGRLDGKSFWASFAGHFVGAGLMEELLKAVPALLALVFALVLRARGGPGNWLTRRLALGGPVDGLLTGAASGAAFILYETLGEYVPFWMGAVTKASQNEAAGLLVGFFLMFPRVLQGVSGHMAWAGISGYFLGLIVSHPRDAWKLLPLAWAVPAGLHAFWNATNYVPGIPPLVPATLTVLIFVACLLKAKQLEVSRLGTPLDGHSILAASPQYAPAAPAGIVPPPLPGVAGLVAGAATALERSVGFTARTTVPVPGETPPPLPAAFAPPSDPDEASRLRRRIEELSAFIHTKGFEPPA